MSNAAMGSSTPKTQEEFESLILETLRAAKERGEESVSIEFRHPVVIAYNEAINSKFDAEVLKQVMRDARDIGKAIDETRPPITYGNLSSKKYFEALRVMIRPKPEQTDEEIEQIVSEIEKEINEEHYQLSMRVRDDDVGKYERRMREAMESLITRGLVRVTQFVAGVPTEFRLNLY